MTKDNASDAMEQGRWLFIGATAHDLPRTPFFTLESYLAVLQAGMAAHYLEVCRELAAATERLIDSLFADSRLLLMNIA